VAKNPYKVWLLVVGFAGLAGWLIFSIAANSDDLGTAVRMGAISNSLGAVGVLALLLFLAVSALRWEPDRAWTSPEEADAYRTFLSTRRLSNSRESRDEFRRTPRV
jgi:hypothetical protein